MKNVRASKNQKIKWKKKLHEAQKQDKRRQSKKNEKFMTLFKRSVCAGSASYIVLG